MKRATLLVSPNPRAKRVCFDKDNGKVSSFKPDAVPENHFHLGGYNYTVVSDFACVARIHLRPYKLDATGSLLSTEDGITVTPSVWLALVREFAAIDQAFDDGKVFVIKDCLPLSRTVIENVTYIICQSYFQRKDFSRKFLTPVSMLKETEWNALKDIQKQITSKTVSIMFGRVFLKLLRKEVAKHIPFPLFLRQYNGSQIWEKLRTKRGPNEGEAQALSSPSSKAQRGSRAKQTQLGHTSCLSKVFLIKVLSRNSLKNRKLKWMYDVAAEKKPPLSAM
ncbi:PC4 domain-containing protein [Trichonephila clavipes]|nr:PC4 domain-containing protein [Trichonephila clavipes]